MKNWSLAFGITLFPLLCLLGIFLFRYYFFAQYLPLIQEDSFFEWLQFGFYFLASVVFAWQAGHLHRWPVAMRVLLACGAVALFWVAGEEISWGQRLFLLHNPAYFAQHNIQGELSIHNLDIVQPFVHGGYIVVCLLLSIAEPVIVLLQRLFQRVPGLKKWLEYLRGLAPKWYFASYFFPVSVFYALFVFWRPFGAIMRNGVPLMVGRDQEVFETFLALGIALTAVQFYFAHRTLLGWSKSYSLGRTRQIGLPQGSY